MMTCSSRSTAACGRRGLLTFNRWSRKPATRSASAPWTWAIYAGVLRQWLEFVQSRGVNPVGGELRLTVSAYAGHRLSGPLEVRLRFSTTAAGLPG